MAIPNVNTTVLDNALGLSLGSSRRTQVKIGVSSAGPTNELVSINDFSTLKATFGTGPLVEAAARVIAIAGGPVYCMRVASSSAGTGTLTKTGAGTATLALSSANVLDAYDVIIEIVTGGPTLTAGVATFRYSLDGGNSYSPTLAVPTTGNYIIDGFGTITWTYSTGTALVAGDRWVGSYTAPGFSTSNLAAAMTALLADPRTWFAVHVVGVPADLTAARALYAALASHMATAFARYRYAFGVMEAPEGTDAALIANTTGFGDLADVRVAVGGGSLDVISPISGRAYKRNVAWEAMARASKVKPSQDIAAVEDGPLSGVVSLMRNEDSTPALDEARFLTARTIIGRQGFYVTRGRLMAPAGSDFSLITNRRVMDIACNVSRDVALGFLNSKVPVNKNGTILETAARAIEKVVEARLRGELVQTEDAVDVSVAVDRAVNILSTGRLIIRIRVLPYGYASAIELELGFTSPSIAAAA